MIFLAAEVKWVIDNEGDIFADGKVVRSHGAKRGRRTGQFVRVGYRQERKSSRPDQASIITARDHHTNFLSH